MTAVSQYGELDGRRSYRRWIGSPRGRRSDC